MSELPESWIAAALHEIVPDPQQDIVDGPFGSNLKASEYQDSGIPIIRLQNVARNHFLEKNIKFITHDKADELQRHNFIAGDIAMTKLGDPLGKAAIIPSKLPRGVIVADIVRLRVDERYADPRYLTYAINSPDVCNELAEKTKGTTRPRVNLGHIRSLQIPVAPLNEQKRIADKLDVVLARVNTCRERLDRVPAILKRFRQAVLAAATSGQLTEEWREANSENVNATELAAQIRAAHEAAGGHKAGNAAPPTDDVHDLSVDMFPPGWALLTLRDMVLPERPITYGILKPGPELEKGVPYIRVADFPNGRLNLSAIRKTSPKIDEEFKRSRLKGGDLLLSIRGTVGRLIVIPEELEGANITQDSARLSIQPLVNRDYVLWFLRSELAQTRMKGAVKGVAVRGINIGDVRALQVPLPSRAEQNEIVRHIEALFAYADRLEARYITARVQVERLTPALLAKAFRGELVQQDPNDEPASVLLERIRAARAAQPTAKRGRKPPATRVPRAPKEKAAMTKSRQDDDVQHKPYLAGLLREAGGIASVEDLFRRAELPVTDFYKQLAWEVENGHIRDDETRLEAA